MFFYAFHLVSPQVNILHYYSAFATTNEPTLVRDSSPYSILTSQFPHHVLSATLASHLVLHITFSQHVSFGYFRL